VKKPSGSTTHKAAPSRRPAPPALICSCKEKCELKISWRVLAGLNIYSQSSVQAKILTNAKCLGLVKRTNEGKSAAPYAPKNMIADIPNTLPKPLEFRSDISCRDMLHLLR
jgi:hypothetical protein